MTERLTLSGLVFSSNFISFISFLHSFCIVILIIIISYVIILYCIYSSLLYFAVYIFLHSWTSDVSRFGSLLSSAVSG